MEKKPLDSLISAACLWMSRAGILHKIKNNEVSKRKIYIETECGNRFVVNNSRNSRTARALRHHKFRKTCKNCSISEEETVIFLTKVKDIKSQAKVKVGSARNKGPVPQVLSTPQVKRAISKTQARTSGWFGNQLSTLVLMSLSSSPSGFSFPSDATKSVSSEPVLVSLDEAMFTLNQFDRLRTLLSPQDKFL